MSFILCELTTFLLLFYAFCRLNINSFENNIYFFKKQKKKFIIVY